MATLAPLVLQSSQLQPFRDFLLSSIAFHTQKEQDVSSYEKPQLLFHRLEALRLQSTLEIMTTLMQTDVTEGKAAVSAPSKEDNKEERLTSVTMHKIASSSSAPATDKKRKEGRSGIASRRLTSQPEPLQEPNEKPVTSPPLAKHRHSDRTNIAHLVAKFGGSPALKNPATGGAESVRLHVLSSTGQDSSALEPDKSKLLRKKQKLVPFMASSLETKDTSERATDRSPRPLVIATSPQVTGPEAKSVSPAAPSEHEKSLCQACLEEVVLVHFLASKKCSHPARYCGVCRAAAYAAKVEQGQPVVCDYSDCNMQATYKDYREVLIGADRKDLMESVATLMDRKFPTFAFTLTKKTAASAYTSTLLVIESVFCCECNTEYPAGGRTRIECLRPGCGFTTCVRHKRKTFSKLTQKEKHAQFCCEIGEFEQASQQEKQERFQELILSERWKEDNCRLCPHCGRLVNKLDGCDRMKCGQDYHGGNVQSGCGGDFNWSQTEPYRSATLQSLSTAQAPSAATAAATGWTCQDCRAQWESSAEYCRNCYWVCSACTMHNALVMEYCEACENQRNL